MHRPLPAQRLQDQRAQSTPCPGALPPVGSCRSQRVQKHYRVALPFTPAGERMRRGGPAGLLPITAREIFSRPASRLDLHPAGVSSKGGARDSAEQGGLSASTAPAANPDVSSPSGLRLPSVRETASMLAGAVFSPPPPSPPSHPAPTTSPVDTLKPLNHSSRIQAADHTLHPSPLGHLSLCLWPSCATPRSQGPISPPPLPSARTGHPAALARPMSDFWASGRPCAPGLGPTTLCQDDLSPQCLDSPYHDAAAHWSCLACLTQDVSVQNSTLCCLHSNPCCSLPRPSTV